MIEAELASTIVSGVLSDFYVDCSSVACSSRKRRRSSSPRWHIRCESESWKFSCAGGHSVRELQEVLALGQPIVAQQLAILRNQNIVVTQKQRLSVRYTLRHPLVGDLLDVARRIFNNQLVSTRGLLRELQRESRRSGSTERSSRSTGSEKRSARDCILADGHQPSDCPSGLQASRRNPDATEKWETAGVELG